MKSVLKTKSCVIDYFFHDKDYSKMGIFHRFKQTLILKVLAMVPS